MTKAKIRQPVAQIGALTLWKLAMAAASDVSNGDETDEYVKEIRALSDRAAGIALRRLATKGLDPIKMLEAK